MNRPSEAIVDAWIALMRAQQAALLKIERVLRAAGLPPAAWYDALWELERAGADGLRPFELESQRLIAQSNVSRLIDRLEHDGLVERRACTDDGRGQIVVLTAAGRDMRRRMWPVYAKAIADTIGRHLTDREAIQITNLLRRLFGSAE